MKQTGSPQFHAPQFAQLFAQFRQGCLAQRHLIRITGGFDAGCLWTSQVAGSRLAGDDIRSTSVIADLPVISQT
jgi:hypothetical protein